MLLQKLRRHFTAEKSDGEVELKFTFDGSKYAGKDVVVFENIMFDGKIVGQHADMEDAEQTINLPAVHTTAKDKKTGKSDIVYEDGKTITVVDTVKYINIIPGEEYKVTGVLMDKATGKPLTDADGKQITSEKTFTPVTESGTIEMEFTFDISDIAGKDVVVFEKLYLGEDIVGSHEDINDEEQTVSIIKEVKTGDEIPMMFYIALVLMMVAVTTTVVIVRKRKAVRK